MDHIIRHSYTASTDGQSVEALLRSHGYSKSLINRIKLTEDGLMIRGAKVYTTFRMKTGDRMSHLQKRLLRKILFLCACRCPFFTKMRI